MSQAKDGGPAFPQSEEQYALTPGHAVKVTQGGLSVRDFFAASALMGMMGNFGKLDSSYEQIAGHAYCVADALLAERAKREGGE